jgi:hypothetical protein
VSKKFKVEQLLEAIAEKGINVEQFLEAIAEQEFAEINETLKKFSSTPFVREREIPPGTEHPTQVFHITIENIEKVIVGGGNMSTFENKDSVVGQQGDHGHGVVNNPTLVHTSIDSGRFLSELAAARAALKKRAATDDDPDLDEAIGTIATAEKQAKSGDTSGAIKTLKAAAKWVLEIGKSVSVELLKDAIEGKFGS